MRVNLPRKWQILLIVSLGTFMGSLDVFIVNVAFPAIQRDFGTANLAALSWVLNAYAIIFAAFLVPAGRMADRFGHRSAFLAGLLLFTGGSALCGVSLTVPMLIGARVVQALGAALLTPTSLALILPAFPDTQRGVAVGVWSAISGTAASAGPTVGGLLVQSSWRWVFFVNVPIGLLCALLTLRVVHSSGSARETGPRPDLLGALLLALGIAALSLDLVEGSGWSWLGSRTLGVALGALVLLVAFVSRSARHPVPVVDLSLLRVRTFVIACIGSGMIGAGLAAILLSLILLTSGIWHYSILRAGLAITPGPLMAGTFAILSGGAANRIAPRLATLGALSFAAGAAWWVIFAGPQPSYVRELLPGMLLTGIGVGLSWTPLTTIAAAILPASRSATGLAVLTMARQIGTALGISILVAIVGASTQNTSVSLLRHGWLFIVGVAVVDLIAVRLLLPTPQGRPEPESPSPQTAVVRPETASYTAAVRGASNGYEPGCAEQSFRQRTDSQRESTRAKCGARPWKEKGDAGAAR
jgi:EmrB/QacA subfamily drug resistance transporter